MILDSEDLLMDCTARTETDNVVKSKTSIFELPDSIYLVILGELLAQDVLACGQTCRRWRAVSSDESVWRNLVYSRWNIHCKIAPGCISWKEEYKRMYYKAPLMLSETLTDHMDEVLHVSFSKNGYYFATTSKDCSVKVWQVGHPTRLKYSHNFREDLDWDFTQFSSFNKTDTMLLVSSVKATEIDRRGFVAVFSLVHNFRLLRVVSMDPSQLFGTWLNIDTFLGGTLEIHLDRFSTTVRIQSFEVEEQSMPVEEIKVEMNSGLVLFTFCSETASLIKFLTVVNVPCVEDKQNDNDCDSDFPSSDSELDWSNSQPQASFDPGENKTVRSTSNVVSDKLYSHGSTTDYLIYVTGEFAVALHQLGFKDISTTAISDIALVRTNESLDTDYDKIPSRMVVNYSSQNLQMRRICKPDLSDHMIDLNGHVTGLSISQDKRYLFVNCRPWTGVVDRSDLWETPDISPDIEIRVIDLQTMCDTGLRYRGHKGYSSARMCCFVFLDTNDKYVASGSEDMQAYIWDKHYHCCLGTYAHGPGVVNAVAFNPHDEQYLVTVSDDHTIKIWRSRKRLKELSVNSTESK